MADNTRNNIRQSNSSTDNVLECIGKAKKAFAANEFEEARQWLIKSQWILYTVNAQDIIAEQLAAIHIREAPKESSIVIPKAGPDDGDTNSVADQKPSESNPTARAKQYTDWAQDAYNRGDIKNAESFLKLPELYHSTKRTRELLVTILKAKHGITNESDDGHVNVFVVITYSRKKKTSETNVIKGNGYLRSAEDAFIKGEYVVAKDLVAKSEVHPSSYVTELTEKIKCALIRNSHWFGEIISNVF